MENWQTVICDAIDQGMTAADIAAMLDIPESWVWEAVADEKIGIDYDPEPDYDDGSADAEALASAGWGTDEDYGGDCEYL
jgi:hypothetical protein